MPTSACNRDPKQEEEEEVKEEKVEEEEEAEDVFKYVREIFFS